jgi:hypothetical protein
MERQNKKQVDDLPFVLAPPAGLEQRKCENIEDNLD